MESGCNRPQMSTPTCAPSPQGTGTFPPSFGDQKCCGTPPPRPMAPARRHRSLLLCGAQAEIEGPAKIATIGFRQQISHPQPPRSVSSPCNDVANGRLWPYWPWSSHPAGALKQWKRIPISTKHKKLGLVVDVPILCPFIVDDIFGGCMVCSGSLYDHCR